MAKQNVVFSNEGRSHSINASDDKAVRDVMAAQAGLTDRYIKIEPAVSAAFGAPACYQKKTEEREDLLAYLQSRHPSFTEAEKVSAQADAAKAKGDPTTAHELSLKLAVIMNKVHGDVANAVRAMKKYFEAGNKGERKTREEQSPRQILESTRTKLEKIAESTDWPATDLKLAKAGVTAINAILGDRKGAGLDKPAAAATHPERANGKVKDVTAEYVAAAE